MKALLYEMHSATDMLQVTHGWQSTYLEIFVPDLKLGFNHMAIERVTKSNYRTLKPIKELNLKLDEVSIISNYFIEKQIYEKLRDRLLKNNTKRKKQKS